MLHDQEEHLKTVQQVLGHKSAATTTIYQELPESEVHEVLKRTGKGYDEWVFYRMAANSSLSGSSQFDRHNNF